MEPKQQRIAIAESRGWKDVEMIHYKGPFLVGIDPIITNDSANFPTKSGVYKSPVPNYLNSRSAMIEAVVNLPVHLREPFSTQLIIGMGGCERDFDMLHRMLFYFITAPLSVIAEAYLRTVGRLEE